MDKKYNKVMWIVLAVFAMGIIPGTGFKADDKQALVVSKDITCGTYKDCPTCMGGFGERTGAALVENATIFDELAYSQCVGGKCELSEYCISWSCGTDTVHCKSVKQTILDNTIAKLQNNPILVLAVIGGLVMFLLL